MPSGGSSTANAAPFDVPAPGWFTVTVAPPAVANRPAVTIAVNRVALTKVVCDAVVVPPAVHWTTDEFVKLVPLTVMVVEGLPTRTDSGESGPTMVGGTAQLLIARIVRAASGSEMKRGMADADPADAKLRLTVPVPGRGELLSSFEP